MTKQKAVSTLTATVALSFALATMAPMAALAAQDDPQIYGSEMMTEQERLEHRTRMQNAETNEERERIRAEHHEQMQERAAAMGKVLPDEPPAQGMGQGGGMGQGMGMGKKKGMGQGMGGGRNN